MKDDELLQTAATICIIVVVAPIVIGGVITIVSGVANVGINMVNKINFKKKIKKGLKDGSICEINGEYYEIQIDDVDRA